MGGVIFKMLIQVALELRFLKPAIKHIQQSAFRVLP